MPKLDVVIRQVTRGDPYARTPEEHAQMEADMRAQLRAMGNAIKPQETNSGH